MGRLQGCVAQQATAAGSKPAQAGASQPAQAPDAGAGAGVAAQQSGSRHPVGKDASTAIPGLAQQPSASVQQVQVGNAEDWKVFMTACWDEGDEVRTSNLCPFDGRAGVR